VARLPFLILLIVSQVASTGRAEEAAPFPFIPDRRTAPPLSAVRSIPRDADALKQMHQDSGGRWIFDSRNGAEPLTLDANLQRQLDSILRDYRPPYASVVALEPKSGRILAMSEVSREQPDLRGLSTQAVFPAASIFKIVTASALLRNGVAPEDEECFHGGKHRLTERLLIDSRRDRRCFSLSLALAHSANVVFAKFTLRHLTPQALRAEAFALGFNGPLPFEVPTTASLAKVPEEEFELANAAAGFGDVYLSPLHGALLAASVANRGQWIEPVLFAKNASDAPLMRRVIPETVALALADMMELTVKRGTAHRVFRQRGYRVPGAVGKTGSIADRRPYRDYSWFVGYAPRENPQIAVGAVIVNDARWRIKATWLAREAMRLYLDKQRRSRNPADAPAAEVAKKQEP
jgi:cell division protein FtsI/penicillin-binding protein 2